MTFPYSSHLLLIQLREWMPRSSHVSIVPDAIALIFCVRIPPEILNRVVQEIAIVVACLHSVWARSTKCFKDQATESLSLDTSRIVYKPKMQVSRWPSLRSQSFPYVRDVGISSATSARPDRSVRAKAIVGESLDCPVFNFGGRESQLRHALASF